MLNSIPEISLELNPQAVIINVFLPREFQITGEKISIRKGNGFEIGFLINYHIELLGKLIMQHICMMNVRFDIAIYALLNQILIRYITKIAFLAILPTISLFLLETIVAEVQSRIAA
jgi:hypothetical protein